MAGILIGSLCILDTAFLWLLVAGSTTSSSRREDDLAQLQYIYEYNLRKHRI